MNKVRQKRERRKKRVRGKIVGTKKKPRLTVYRSNKHIYGQLIDDMGGETLASFSSQNLKKKAAGPEASSQDRSPSRTESGQKGKSAKKEIASAVGEELAKKAKKKKIKTAVFDRGQYKYHGRVKALADGARKGGLNF